MKFVFGCYFDLDVHIENKSFTMRRGLTFFALCLNCVSNGIPWTFNRRRDAIDNDIAKFSEDASDDLETPGQIFTDESGNQPKINGEESIDEQESDANAGGEKTEKIQDTITVTIFWTLVLLLCGLWVLPVFVKSFGFERTWYQFQSSADRDISRHNTAKQVDQRLSKFEEKRRFAQISESHIRNLVESRPDDAARLAADSLYQKVSGEISELLGRLLASEKASVGSVHSAIETLKNLLERLISHYNHPDRSRFGALNRDNQKLKRDLLTANPYVCLKLLQACGFLPDLEDTFGKTLLFDWCGSDGGLIRAITGRRALLLLLANLRAKGGVAKMRLLRRQTGAAEMSDTDPRSAVPKAEEIGPLSACFDILSLLAPLEEAPHVPPLMKNEKELMPAVFSALKTAGARSLLCKSKRLNLIQLPQLSSWMRELALVRLEYRKAVNDFSSVGTQLSADDPNVLGEELMRKLKDYLPLSSLFSLRLVLCGGRVDYRSPQYVLCLGEAILQQLSQVLAVPGSADDSCSLRIGEPFPVVFGASIAVNHKDSSYFVCYAFGSYPSD